MENDVIENLPPYWIWENGISSELCDLLLKERSSMEEEPAIIDKGTINESVRKSDVCWAPVNHWIEGVMYNYGLYATKWANWDFQLGRPERIQLAVYDKSNFYGWHEDWSPFEIYPTIRKVSVVMLLSDPSEFEGGEFQFQENESVKMKKGSVIAFPSFLKHQVTPVTSGKRYSAVCWINGPRTF